MYPEMRFDVLHPPPFPDAPSTGARTDAETMAGPADRGGPDPAHPRPGAAPGPAAEDRHRDDGRWAPPGAWIGLFAVVAAAFWAGLIALLV